MSEEEGNMDDRIVARCHTSQKEAILVAADNSNRKFGDYVRLVCLAAAEAGTKV